MKRKAFEKELEKNETELVRLAEMDARERRADRRGVRGSRDGPELRRFRRPAARPPCAHPPPVEPRPVRTGAAGS